MKPIDPLKIISIKESLKAIKLLDPQVIKWPATEKVKVFRELFNQHELDFDEWRKSNATLGLFIAINT
jgi:hypothetical protein